MLKKIVSSGDVGPGRGLAGLAAAAVALALMGAQIAGGGAAAAGPKVQTLDALAALVTRIAVFGKDDRRPVPPQHERAAQSIGVLFNDRTNTVCSAFCVGPNIIATAAHCLSAQKPGRAPATSGYKFARNYNRTRDFVRLQGAATRSSEQNMVTGDFQLRMRPPIDAVHDWALVRLAKPACADRELEVRPLSAAELIEQARAGRVFQVSYHRDFTRWKPAHSGTCSVARDFEGVDWATTAHDFLEADRLILHTCDTGSASSGSPLLLETAAGPVVVGINVGTYMRSKVVMQDGEVTHRQRAETVANTAVSAEAFAGKIDLLRNAVILSSGPPMRHLQERLQQHKLYSGKLDGTYGPALRAAIASYERARSLPVTGLATHVLLLRLASEPAETSSVSRQPDAVRTKSGPD